MRNPECTANEIAERVGSVPRWAFVHCRTEWKRQALKRVPKMSLPLTSATPYQLSLVTQNWGASFGSIALAEMFLLSTDTKH